MIRLLSVTLVQGGPQEDVVFEGHVFREDRILEVELDIDGQVRTHFRIFEWRGGLPDPRPLPRRFYADLRPYLGGETDPEVLATHPILERIGRAVLDVVEGTPAELPRVVWEGGPLEDPRAAEDPRVEPSREADALAAPPAQESKSQKK